jgi:hypothetical protein
MQKKTDLFVRRNVAASRDGTTQPTKRRLMLFGERYDGWLKGGALGSLDVVNKSHQEGRHCSTSSAAGLLIISLSQTR